MKYRVDLGSKIWKKMEKIYIMGIFGSHVPVHLESVPVHVRDVPVHLMLYSQFRPGFIFWP